MRHTLSNKNISIQGYAVDSHQYFHTYSFFIIISFRVEASFSFSPFHSRFQTELLLSINLHENVNSKREAQASGAQLTGSHRKTQTTPVHNEYRHWETIFINTLALMADKRPKNTKLDYLLAMISEKINSRLGWGNFNSETNFALNDRIRVK